MNPVISLTNLLKEFDRALSNLYIYFLKSEAMAINLLQPHLVQLQSSFRLKWNSMALTYLGTTIPAHISKVFDLNFPYKGFGTPKQMELRPTLVVWLLKRSILPKFLYQLQVLPIHIPANYFQQIRKVFFEYIWNHKLKRSQLTLPKQLGGLAVPDVHKYYQAVNLGRLVDWNRHRTLKLWIQLKQGQSSVPLNRAPWCYNSLPNEVKSHPLLGQTTKVCSLLYKRGSLSHLRHLHSTRY